METPIVSVAMITYNHAPYIAQAIEGVLWQKTNFQFELIIGEDCSTDTTRDIVLHYQAKYPELIRAMINSKNVGMKKNFCQTVNCCRGKYIAFCEGDDYWQSEEKLQKQVEHLESHPACSMVFTDFDKLIQKTGEIEKRFCFAYGNTAPFDLSLTEIFTFKRGLTMLTCTVLARMDLAKQVIKNDPYLHQSDNFLMADAQLWVELAHLGKLTYLPENWSVWRVLEESASHTKSKYKDARITKSCFDVKLYLCEKYGLGEEIKKDAMMHWCNATLRVAFHERNGALATEVRQKKEGKFTFEEWLRYFGAKNSIVYYISLVVSWARTLYEEFTRGKFFHAKNKVLQQRPDYTMKYWL